MPPTNAPFPSPGHDHASCVSDALSRAEVAFAAKSLKLTEQRRLVLAEIAASHCAIGAYEVLDRLARKGQRLAPISVYRALEALLETGVVHRLESRNAYFACLAPHKRSTQVVLTCGRCGETAEVDGGAVNKEILAAASTVGFRPERPIIEVAGVCGRCG